MSGKRKSKLSAREKKQARQARRIVNGIFIALIVLMVVSVTAAALFSN